MASKHPDEGQSASDDGDPGAELPFRAGGTERKAPAEARPELRDRETYYAELRFAVHCQSRSIPQPRAAPDDQEADLAKRRPDDEGWDDMTARFGDTWTLERSAAARTPSPALGRLAPPPTTRPGTCD